MRKIELRMNELFAYEKIKRYVDQGGNFKRLCLELGISERTARRKVAGYKEQGKQFFVHGNRSRKPSCAISQEARSKIVQLYKDPLYEGANFAHFHELLERRHPELATFSLASLRNILADADIISPMATRKTKKEHKKRVAALDKASVNKSEMINPREKPLPIDKDPHPRREKSKHPGELLFMDASMHDWLEIGQKIHLHAAIDDATGTVTGASFEQQETIVGYYEVMRQTLSSYGVPYGLQTDGRSIFEYAAFKNPKPHKESYTQFTYACKNLGISLHTTPSAQAQGKIERLFGTLQSRLIIELRLRRIKTIKEANEFLPVYLPQYNKQFATSHPHDTPNVFVDKPSEEKMNLTLAILTQRTIDNGNCIRFENNYYRLLDERVRQVNLRPKSKVLVIKALDGKLYATYDESIFALEKLASHKQWSKVFDKDKTKPKKKTITIPDMDHPWKRDEFDKYQRQIWNKVYDTDWTSVYSHEDIWYTQERLY